MSPSIRGSRNRCQQPDAPRASRSEEKAPGRMRKQWRKIRSADQGIHELAESNSCCVTALSKLSR